MKPALALHRSVMFWLGCFVLMFLGWVWADSRKAISSVYQDVEIRDTRPVGLMADPVRYPAWYVNGATLYEGTLLLSYARVVEVKPHAALSRGGLGHIRTAPDYKWQVPALGPMNSGEATGLARVRYYSLRVPLWGVIAGFAMVWGGLLVWRWRRAMRMMAAQADECGRRF